MLALGSLNKIFNAPHRKLKQDYWFDFYIKNSFVGCNLIFVKLHSFRGEDRARVYFSGGCAPFRVYFLKQEPFYTKLKYSRVPQFDTASGAAASFLSGMYGFLVCEKFGFELLDSGDFLFVIMYIALSSLIVTSLITTLNNPSNILNSLIDIFRSFFKI